jgi:uncharacterized protein HemX
MFLSARQGSWRIWLVIGLGLCLYGYYEQSRLHIPSDTELAAAIETQYRSEIARLQEQAGDAPIDLTPEWQDKFRTAIRNERLAPIEKARQRIESLIGVGLILVVLAAGMFVFNWQTEKQKTARN